MSHAVGHYLVLAEYFPREGRAEQVISLLRELAEASRSESGNLGYRFHQDLERPDRILIEERYTDAAAFQAHRDSEHFQRIGVGCIIPLLADRVITAYVGPA
ncbi:quinol monooxygenase YgiN [Spinactinospora alkalitolerans]|uniref:Quinol monooxygenase YgiN n=1 Tax=Spinactinospora alkalitolerans TaxID=687207 RepID=A0A852U1A7_9ACTN|nr:putative quinol monooxygenase [Spinactinospora alkalitolerans]NYE47954.1 quinol monooxygenase YgiN [Spinactinospora alkalitolerans]